MAEEKRSNQNEWLNIRSVSGYLVHEVGSAMQKEIRRGSPDNAMFWASELFLSGYDKYAWKRLKIILVEDLDVIGNQGLSADIWSLYRMAMEARKDRKDRNAYEEVEALGLMAAVTKLAVAAKSRVNCNATVYYVQMPREATERKAIPDYALDRHTVAGKRKGRNWKHFFEEGAKIDYHGQITAEEPDPYRQPVQDWLEKGGKRVSVGENQEPNATLFG